MRRGEREGRRGGTRGRAELGVLSWKVSKIIRSEAVRVMERQWL